MPVLHVINLDRRNSASCFLNQHARKIHSQNGEDGILEQLFGIIGAENQWCVEFGAWDGVYLSNTCHFIRNLGWSGVQIEGNAAKFAELKENFSAVANTRQIQRIIGFSRVNDTIDDALAATPIPRDFDFISIDIDGNDYHIWRSMARYKLRVVVMTSTPVRAPPRARPSPTRFRRPRRPARSTCLIHGFQDVSANNGVMPYTTTTSRVVRGNTTLHSNTTALDSRSSQPL